jgi:hypothetical protein
MSNKVRKLERDVAKLPGIPKELVSLFVTGPMTGLAFKKPRFRSVSASFAWSHSNFMLERRHGACL